MRRPDMPGHRKGECSMPGLPRVFTRKARFKGEWGRVATVGIGHERISVAPSVRLNQVTADRDSSLAYKEIDLRRNPRSRRHEQPAEPIRSDHVTAPIPVISATGMRRNAGVATAAIFCFLLGVLFLIRLSDMTETSKAVSNLQARIEQVSQSNDQLESSLATLTSEVNVGYEAAKLGMISANGVDVIYVMAPETRTSAALLRDEVEVEPAHSEFFALLLGL